MSTFSFDARRESFAKAHKICGLFRQADHSRQPAEPLSGLLSSVVSVSAY